MNAVLYCCVMALVYSSSLTAGAAKISPHRAMDLNYGSVLYHYYQDDWYEALLGLESFDMVAMSQQHRFHPALVKAGILLSYGMPENAQLTIEKLLSLKTGDINNQAISAAEPSLSLTEDEIDYAQFALLKSYYEQRSYAKASRIAANFSFESATTQGSIEQPYKQELYYLTGSLQLNYHHNAGVASTVLLSMDTKTTWYRYLLFNLSVYYLQQSDLASAEAVLAPFITGNSLRDASAEFAPLSIDEVTLLNDRLQSLWVLLLKRKGNQEAMLSALDNLHLQTGTARQLLLLYAKELALKKQPRQAEQILAFVQAQSPKASNDLDILYIQAFIKEQTSDVESVFKHFSNLAIQAEVQLATLESQKAVLNDAALSTYLDGSHLSFYSSFYQSYYSPAFQENLAEYQSLLQLQQKVAVWLKDIEVYQWVLDEKKQYWADKATTVNEVLQAQNTVNLKEECDAILKKIQLNEEASFALVSPGLPINAHTPAAKHSVDNGENLEIYAKLASEQWRGQYKRLAKAKNLRADFSTENDPRTQKWDSQIRRVQGLLLWQGSESLPKNIWQHRKLIKDVDQQVAQFERNRQQLASRLLQSESLDSLSNRLNALEPNVSAFRKEVAQALEISRRSLTDKVLIFLTSEQASATAYLKLSRVALAKLAKRRVDQNSDLSRGRQID